MVWRYARARGGPQPAGLAAASMWRCGTGLGQVNLRGADPGPTPAPPQQHPNGIASWCCRLRGSATKLFATHAIMLWNNGMFSSPNLIPRPWGVYVPSFGGDETKTNFGRAGALGCGLLVVGPVVICLAAAEEVGEGALA